MFRWRCLVSGLSSSHLSIPCTPRSRYPALCILRRGLYWMTPKHEESVAPLHYSPYNSRPFLSSDGKFTCSPCTGSAHSLPSISTVFSWMNNILIHVYVWQGEWPAIKHLDVYCARYSGYVHCHEALGPLFMLCSQQFDIGAVKPLTLIFLLSPISSILC